MDCYIYLVMTIESIQILKNVQNRKKKRVFKENKLKMNFLLNNRLVLVFIGPFFLGCLSVFFFSTF